VGLAFGFAGAVIQLIWPRTSYVLTLKTASGDVEALDSEDRTYIAAVERALEQAFAERP
jgi:hypothetical protein